MTNNQIPITKQKSPSLFLFGYWLLNIGICLVIVSWLLVIPNFLSGCAPTYPKEKIGQGIVDLCKKEYKVTVDTKALGNTVAVYLPVDRLFNAVLNLDTKASKKINDVILGVTRVTLSTDAKFDFYVVIAQDPQMAEIEIVYIRYVGDVKRFLLGDISRDEYAKRAVIQMKTPPQMEREKVLKGLFAKLNIENSDEMIKEYLGSEEKAAGIGDINYWNKKFYIKEINLPEFLASQIEERVKMDFKQERDLNRWYELKSAEGKYAKTQAGSRFIFIVNIANRVEPLYDSSGMELGAYKKRTLVFEKLLGIVTKVLWSYRFEDFDKVEISTPAYKIRLGKEKLWGLKKGKIRIEELMYPATLSNM